LNIERGCATGCTLSAAGHVGSISIGDRNVTIQKSVRGLCCAETNCNNEEVMLSELRAASEPSRPIIVRVYFLSFTVLLVNGL